MFCPKCGAQNPEGSPFCGACGAPLSQQQAPVNQGGSNPMNGFNAQDMINDFKSNITNFKSFGIAQFIALGGAVLLIVSLFLPFIKVGFLGISVSGNMFKAGALHWLLAILIALGSAFLAVTKKGLNMLIAGCVAVAYFIMEAIWQHEDFATFTVGFYFMLIACAAICVGGVLQFLADKKK